jgi:hypothetical protein
MNQVYIVMDCYDTGVNYISAVFESEELAQDYIENHIAPSIRMDFRIITQTVRGRDFQE